ncbi:MAG: aspartate kinase, partial [Sediminibacterium sp.]
MRVMKFGGTSVGKPERMHQVSQLITRDDEPTIVVLSALSGTTNSLVEISQCLASQDKKGSAEKIEALEKHYALFINDLIKEQAIKTRAESIIKEHFEFLSITQRISLSDALNKDILAQGELMSTKLFSLYLEQEKIEHALIPA